MSTRILKIHSSDNVAVALENLDKDQWVEVDKTSLQLKDDVPVKHKFTLGALKSGDPVMMYGVMVGKVQVDLEAGSIVTTENLRHSAQDYQISNEPSSWSPPLSQKWEGRTFDGYHRADGKVGTANYWLVIPLVFCENRNLEVIKDSLLKELGYQTERDFGVDTRKLVEILNQGGTAEDLLSADIQLSAVESSQRRVFPNVDGIKFLSHQGGCGGTPNDRDSLCALLAGYITNPNVAGATVLSLGCQHAQSEFLKRELDKLDPELSKPLFFLEQQESKSERDFIAEAVKKTFVGMVEANQTTRQPAGLEKLVVGLECGGSDGFSGISANPALGYTSDLLVSLGGTTILSEFPELHGVEQELIDRCSTDRDARRFMELMSSYAQSAANVGSGFEANPSPGNIRDGLITDAMKSAGAARKGGTSPVVGVLDFTEQVTQHGLNLLCTPGNDVESTTGLAGSGANLIVFTTGLGTPTGNAVAPTIKVSSNSNLYERMQDIIDIDAGTIISGNDTIKDKGEEILDYIIEVASGQKVPRATALGQDDFIPWKRGISL